MTPEEDKAQDVRIERYHALTDRKFLGTLTLPEEEEMERLGLEIDRYFEPFYRPIIARLETELREKRAARNGEAAPGAGEPGAAPGGVTR